MGVISAVPESGGADLSEAKDLNRSTLYRQSSAEILRPGQAGTQNDIVDVSAFLRGPLGRTGRRA